jgi:hypothetical protein
MYSNGTPAYPNCPAGDIFEVSLPAGCEFFFPDNMRYTPGQIVCGKVKKSFPSGCQIKNINEDSPDSIPDYRLYCDTQNPIWPS